MEDHDPGMFKVFVDNTDCLYGPVEFLFSVNMQQMPRMTILISTPARAASVSFLINDSSLRELSLRVMAAGFFLRAF